MKCDENLKKIIFLMSVILKKNMVQKWPLSDQFGFPCSKLSGENYFCSVEIHLEV